PDQRVDLALAGLLIEVDAEIGERRALLALGGAVGTTFALFGTTHLALLARAGLGYAVGNEIDCVETAHVLLFEEISGVAFALGKDCDEHIGAGHFFAAGRLNMDDGALNDALE